MAGFIAYSAPRLAGSFCLVGYRRSSDARHCS